MGYCQIVVPVGTLNNLITNPSIERDTTGWSAAGSSTLARSSAQSRRGAFSLSVTPSATTTDGAYFGTVSLTSGTAYTFTVDVWGVNGVPYRIYFGSTAGAVLGTPATFTGSGAWTRVTVTYTETSSTTRRLYVVKNSHASTGAFYVDGASVTATSYEVAYFDGESAGASWDGRRHSSASTLDGQSRQGGRVYDLDTDLNFNVDAVLGVGMPPAQHLLQKRWSLPDTHFAGRQVQPRTIQVFISPKTTPADLAAIHSLRKDLVDIIKPDLVTGDQPFILRYTGADTARPVEIRVVYDSGLEFGDLNYTAENITLRLIAYDEPYFTDVYETAEHLTTTMDLDVSYVLGRVNGVWNNLGGGLGGAVWAGLAKGPDGCIYIGGAFTTLGGGGAMYRIAKWDGSSWSALGAGLNGSVLCLAFGTDGSLYAGGAFTDVQGGPGGTYNKIAKWDGSNWSALGTGMDGSVFGLTVGLDGTLYATGQFTTAGGGAAVRVASWDGSTWSAMGTGLNLQGDKLATAPDGSIYLVGYFTTAGGTTVNGIAKWDGSAWNALGAGFSGGSGGTEGRSVAIAPDGTIYAGGDYTSPSNYIARWNGIAWEPLGSGMDNAVTGLAIDSRGTLYAVGGFTTAGGLALADRTGVWNGSTWAHLDVDFPGSDACWGILTDGSDVYISTNWTGVCKTSYLQAVDNPGSARAYPKLVVKRSGGTSAVVEWLKNETTGATLWLNYSLLDGETLEIDFREGARSCVSDFFGRVWRAILRNSDTGSFCLLPGDNNISVFVNAAGGATIECYLLWTNRHWSAEGAAA